MTDPFYSRFEAQHRGTRELILTRLEIYRPFLEALREHLEQPPRAFDLGCGRGEWLQLTGSIGYAAQGVDLDEGMLDGCRAAGLDAWREDALSALRALPSEMMGVVSGFHFVEHVPFDVVRALTEEALRVLVPGGLLIWETPNPENISVGTSSFYLDPSHERPLPPELLHFAVEHAGFGRAKVLRLQEELRLREPQAASLLDVLRGVSPDYAVVAQKDGPADVLEALDAPFAPEYGVSLDALAEAHDSATRQRLDTTNETLAAERDRLTAASTELQRVSAQVQHVSSQAESLNGELSQLGSEVSRIDRMGDELAQLADRLAQLDARGAEADRRTALALKQLGEVYSSTSWRVSAPLRTVSTTAKRLRAARAEGRLGSAARRRVLRVLKPPPPAPPPSARVLVVESGRDLSPRGRAVYEALTLAVQPERAS